MTSLRPPYLFRPSSTSKRTVANLSAKDLWYIGNTWRPQFTAHYLAHPPLRLTFSSTNVIHRRLLLARLETFSFFFFRLVYRRLRDSLYLRFYFFFFSCLNLNFTIFFIFLFIFILLFFFLLLPPLFLLFFFPNMLLINYFLFLLLVLSFFISYYMILFSNFFLICFRLIIFFFPFFSFPFYIFLFIFSFLFTLIFLFYFQVYIYRQHSFPLIISCQNLPIILVDCRFTVRVPKTNVYKRRRSASRVIPCS